MNLMEKKQLETQLKSLQVRYPGKLNNQIIEQLVQKLSTNGKSFAANQRDLFIVLNNNLDFDKYLQKNGIFNSNEQITNEKVQKEVQTSLNLSNIREFTIGDKNYIQLYYDDNSTKVLENLNNLNTKEIFNYAKDKLNNLSLDGKENAKEIFEELMKDYIEVPLEEQNQINDENLKKEEKVELDLVKSRFPENQIIANAEAKIYIVMGKDGEPNRGYTVEARNNELMLVPLNEKTYGAKEKENTNKDETDSLEIETDSFENETFDNLRDQIITEAKDISEDAVLEELSTMLARANTKEDLYKILQFIYDQKKKNNEQIIEAEKTNSNIKPKTLVLSKNLTPNAFVDALVLAFITAICGAIFLIVLFNGINY